MRCASLGIEDASVRVSVWLACGGAVSVVTLLVGIVAAVVVTLVLAGAVAARIS